jgi:hypothetical protein
VTKNAPLQFVSDADSLSGLYHAAVWKLFGSWDAEQTFLADWGLGEDAEFALVKGLLAQGREAADSAHVGVTVTRSEAHYLLHLLRWFFDIDNRGDECDAITGATEAELKALIVTLEQALSTSQTLS